MQTQRLQVVSSVELPDIYCRWRVRARFITKLMGTMPKNPDALASFCEDAGMTADQASELNEQVKPERDAFVALSGFKQDERGLYIEGRQIKAAFKECGNLLGYMTANPGRQFFQHALFVEPDRLYLDRMEPDGTDRMYGVVMGARGPRNIVTENEYVEGAEIEFLVKALVSREAGPTKTEIAAWQKKADAAAKAGKAPPPEPKGKTVGGITDEQFRRMLALMQDNGMGAKRASGYGKMQITLIEEM